MAVTFRVKNLDHVADLFAVGLGARPTINMTLSVSGKVVDYFLVWEWGRISCKPGPKTMWSTNPDGDIAVMTKTAPNGFIRVNRDKIRQIVHDCVTKRLQWKNMKLADIPKAIEWGLRDAAPVVANLIADTAPIDTGDLRAAIRAAFTTFGAPMGEDQIGVRTRLLYSGGKKLK